MNILEKFRDFHDSRNPIVRWVINMFLWLIIAVIPAALIPSLEAVEGYTSNLSEVLTVWQVISSYIGFILLYGGWLIVSWLGSSWLTGDLEISK